MFLLPMADYSGLDCCHARSSLSPSFGIYRSLYVPLLCCHHQYCLLQVEGDSSEDELHVPFLESGIAHPGETIPSLQGTNTLFNPIAHTADQPVRKTLDEGKRFASYRLVHDPVDI